MTYDTNTESTFEVSKKGLTTEVNWDERNIRLFAEILRARNVGGSSPFWRRMEEQIGALIGQINEIGEELEAHTSKWAGESFAHVDLSSYTL